MTKKMNERGTVVGAFEDQRHAQDAVRDLKQNGFTEEQIGLISHRRETTSSGDTKDVAEGSYAAEGAMTGLAVGAGVGALWGLGIAAGMLPAIGPVIAGGTLASILASAATGAAVAGVGGALMGMGVPEEEAKYYESEFKSGRTLVTVHAGTRTDDAAQILRRHGGYDIQTKDTYRTSDLYRQKLESSQTTGATTHTAAAGVHTPATQSAATHTAATQNTARMGARTGDTANVQLKEEQLNVQKDSCSTGEVRVRKDVVTEHKSIDVPVEREEIVIERHGATSGRATSSIKPGEEVRIPVKEEHVRVDKTPVVKEEVTVGKRKVKGTEHVEADVKREELRVEEEGKARVRR